MTDTIIHKDRPDLAPDAVEVAIFGVCANDFTLVLSAEKKAAWVEIEDGGRKRFATTLDVGGGDGRILIAFPIDKVAELMVRGSRPSNELLPHNLLSDREYEVFNRLVLGRGLTEIGAELSLSVKTISTHKTHILQKMNLTSAADLVRYALAHGLAGPADF